MRGKATEGSIDFDVILRDAAQTHINPSGEERLKRKNCIESSATIVLSAQDTDVGPLTMILVIEGQISVALALGSSPH